MRQIAPIALLSLSMASLAACAPSQPSSLEDQGTTRVSRCIFVDQLNGYRASRDAIYIRGSGKTIYALETLGHCNNLEDSLALTFEAPGGMNQVCIGDWVTVGTGSLVPCRARVTKVLTEAEVAALPAKYRP